MDTAGRDHSGPRWPALEPADLVSGLARARVEARDLDMLAIWSGGTTIAETGGMKKLYLLCALATAACASDEPSVVGEWRTMENAFAEDTIVVGPDRYAFGDDGTLTIDGEEAGRYELDGDRMQLIFTTDEEDLVLAGGFVVTDDRLLLGAHFPEGDVDGAVGTWVGDFMIDGDREQQSIGLAAGGDLTVTENGDPTSGTWEEDGESLRLTFGDYDDLWFRLDERGIGDVMLERVE